MRFAQATPTEFGVRSSEFGVRSSEYALRAGYANSGERLPCKNSVNNAKKWTEELDLMMCLNTDCAMVYAIVIAPSALIS